MTSLDKKWEERFNARFQVIKDPKWGDDWKDGRDYGPSPEALKEFITQELSLSYLQGMKDMAQRVGEELDKPDEITFAEVGPDESNVTAGYINGRNELRADLRSKLQQIVEEK